MLPCLAVVDKVGKEGKNFAVCIGGFTRQTDTIYTYSTRAFCQFQYIGSSELFFSFISAFDNFCSSCCVRFCCFGDFFCHLQRMFFSVDSTPESQLLHANLFFSDLYVSFIISVIIISLQWCINWMAA